MTVSAMQHLYLCELKRLNDNLEKLIALSEKRFDKDCCSVEEFIQMITNAMCQEHSK